MKKIRLVLLLKSFSLKPFIIYLLVIERFKEFSFPILLDLPIGHISGNACIPLGHKATLSGDDGFLSVHSPDD